MLQRSFCLAHIEIAFTGKGHRNIILDLTELPS